MHRILSNVLHIANGTPVIIVEVGTAHRLNGIDEVVGGPMLIELELVRILMYRVKWELIITQMIDTSK
jgi:hypothetical protein